MFKQQIMNHRQFYTMNETKPISVRIEALKKLRQIILKYEQEILTALKEDLNKSEFESYASEISFTLSELDYAVKHIHRWSKRKRVRTPLISFKSTSFIYPEPYGVALIIAPWNYPFLLTLTPLISAIAAGNCAVVKPSEFAPQVAKVIETIVGEVFTANYVSVVQGDSNVANELLQEKFDYIFFTGSTQVGKLIMKQAAEHLTPLTLELGGKSPCIIDQSANIDLAAKRIAWGKILNAGQTCVAPDYILVDVQVKEQLVTRLKHYFKQFIGDHPCENDEYVRIVNLRHFQRLQELMKDMEILFGGESSEENLKIAPTIIDEPQPNTAIMQTEIFGPLLPVLGYQSLAEAISFVKQLPRPLALYLFTTTSQTEQQVLSEISFGGGAINETLMHLATAHLPFGGVGESGFGVCHGKFGFDTFTHYKSILKKSNQIDIHLRYPPYQDKIRLLKKWLK